MVDEGVGFGLWVAERDCRYMPCISTDEIWNHLMELLFCSE